jgi:hypothetical protein
MVLTVLLCLVVSAVRGNKNLNTVGEQKNERK